MNSLSWPKAFLFSLVLHLLIFSGLILANRPSSPKETVIRINLKSLNLAPEPAKNKPPAKPLKPQTKKKSFIPKTSKSKAIAKKKPAPKPAPKKAIKKNRSSPKKVAKNSKAPVKATSKPSKSVEETTKEEQILAKKLAALKAKEEEKLLKEKLAAISEKVKGGLSIGKGISEETTQLIASHLMNFWAVPKILEDKPYLKAEVEIEIAPNGRIISWRFIMRSGEPLFDEAVAATIKKANPLPAPGKYLKLPAVFKMK
ncbi:TonB family protein [Thermodesulfatator autotrophicus]|uniref:TonB C-terminal domain-containing protein n=1 Tax=Thermodesulfatator autotrophicus TaxID=1795632 RepID=A0A177E7G1_9BACT|nr:TonB family protein [Thermodesulfatator autotrophicus]OAG26959.1 hypothetical protein TH606_09425 [Thermodesulfatator autotrophicus]